jgi:hypothetical protein
MRTPITRLPVLALLLVALLPADLALARWTMRSGLPHAAVSAGAGVARETAKRTLATGAEWLGRGADRVGTTLVDMACWVADRAGRVSACTSARTTLGVAPLVTRVQVIVVAEDGGACALPAPPPQKAPASTPSDS